MAEHETIADIIAEMRLGSTGGMPFAYRIGRPDRNVEYKTEDWKKYEHRITVIEKVTIDELADRLEAAHKRERDVMFDALVRIGNWCAQDLAENAYVSDSSGNYLKTLNGLCEVCRPFMRKANKLKKYGGTNG